MHEREWLAEQFEAYHTHLRRVAYRMLGSVNEADDAVQESWLRVSGAGARGIENLGAWLPTIVVRCAWKGGRKSPVCDPVSNG